jgi:hypothetical protein
MIVSPACTASSALTNSRAGDVFEVAVRSLLQRTVDEVRVKVPGVNDNSPGTRIVDKNGNLNVIRFWLGKRVIKSYVDGVEESLV